MGINELWDVLKPGFDERISLQRLVSDFIVTNSRCPRVAVDAYMFLFHSTHTTLDDEALVIRNFMSKVYYLISLNFSVLMVFDGQFKPEKRRNSEEKEKQKEKEKEDINVSEFDGPFHKDYDLQFSIFKTIHPKDYDEQFPLISVIKGLLKQSRIDYLQAPGEGEAQCAYLQRFGIVDYVISNDVDSLVFGATKVLRNFNRYKEDVTISPKKGTNFKTTAKYYVTPVHMAKVKEMTGLTTERLVFLATLRGGDYSLGVKKIGIANATRLALCGTEFAMFYHRQLTQKELKSNITRQPLPDFTQMLMKCVIKESTNKVYVWDLIQAPQKRKPALDSFLKLLNSKIDHNAREIFGRNLTVPAGLLIDEYYLLLYLFPFVTFGVYKFLPSLSFGEFSVPEEDLNLGANYFGSEKVERINNLYPDTTIGYLRIIEDNGEIIQSFELDHNPPILGTILEIPRDFSGRLKTIIARLTSHTEIDDIPITELVQITNEKEEEDVELYMIKYDPNAIGKLFPQSWDYKNPSEPPKLEYIWLPVELVGILNPFLIREYHQIQLQKSPKKQSTTLDNYGLLIGQISPTKETLRRDSPSKTKAPGSPELSPKRLSFSSPKRRKKNVIPPGQKNIDIFFRSNPYNKENPKLMALREDLLPERRDIDPGSRIHTNTDKLSVPPNLISPIKKKTSISASTDHSIILISSEEEDNEKSEDLSIIEIPQPRYPKPVIILLDEN